MDKQEERKLLNTLKSIDGTLKRIEQSLKKKEDKFIPEMSDGQGNVYPITGEPKADSPMYGKEIIPSGKLTAYP